MNKTTSKIHTKLGEVLLNEKIITEEQLDAVLKQQAIYGTRIGSTLLEMGYVNEETRTHLLSVKVGVPVAGPKELLSVSNKLVSVFSGELAIKYHVMPLKLERNRLSLAMTDPTDLIAMDEISFITGYVLQPYIALDLNISKALAKYYGYDNAESRYQLMTSLKEMSAAGSPVKPSKVALPERNTGRQPEAVSSSNACVDVAQDSHAKQVAVCTFDKVLQELAAASSREAVGDSLVKYLGQEFGACGLFIVKGTAAVAWRGAQAGKQMDGLAEFSLPLSKPSVIQDVAESKDSVIGALTNTAVNSQILHTLGLNAEAALIVQPIIMLNKTVAVIIVSGEMDILKQRLEELRKLSRKAALAFEMLIIKSKILTP